MQVLVVGVISVINEPRLQINENKTILQPTLIRDKTFCLHDRLNITLTRSLTLSRQDESAKSIHKQNHCYALSYEREIMKPKSFEYFNNNGKYEIVREDRTDDRVRSTLIFHEISPQITQISRLKTVSSLKIWKNRHSLTSSERRSN